jgi:steroid 5-alpha reductase family enzyme
MAAPGYILLLVSRINPELGLIDVIFGSIIMVLLIIETVADQQQWGKSLIILPASLPLTL